MQAIQCQSCGSYNGPHHPCGTCTSPICARCKAHHENGCQEVARRKALGQGPTVRVPTEIQGVPVSPEMAALVAATEPRAVDVAIAETDQVTVAEMAEVAGDAAATAQVQLEQSALPESTLVYDADIAVQRQAKDAADQEIAASQAMLGEAPKE